MSVARLRSGQRFPPEWRGRYPHMREVEVPLWNRFLELYGKLFGAFEYDVRVGPPSQAAAGFDAQTQAVFADLTRMRIDAVGYRVGEVWLLEVMPYAGVSALGKLLSYAELFFVDRAPVEPIRLGVVTDRFTPAMGEVFRAEEVLVWIV